MIKDIISYFKYKKILRSIYKDTQFITALNASFGVEFRRDAKREQLYTVINPYIQKMNNDGPIYDGNGNLLVERWVYDNFLILEKFIQNHEIFDLVNVKITKLDEDLNFLLVIRNALTETYRENIKKLALIFTPLFCILIILSLILL